MQSKPVEELTEEQKQQLLEALTLSYHELKQQLDSIHERGAPVTLDQQAVGRVSRIDAIQQQQMAQANELQLKRQLLRIEKILQSTDDYGFCLECDEPIGFARLKIHPTAPYCIKCQSNKERG